MSERRTLDETFAILVEAAIKGERCPLSHWERTPDQRRREAPPLLIDNGAISKLAKQGKILIEISGRNWRTVTILVGEHAGKHTALDPTGAHVWQSIGVTRTLDMSSSRRPAPQGPSAPRLIKERGR